MKLKYLVNLIMIMPCFYILSLQASGTSDYEIVSEVNVTKNSRINVYVESNTYINPASCSSSAYYQIPVTDDDTYRSIYSLLLSALLSGKEVKFTISDTTCAPNDVPLIEGVRIKF